MVKPKDPDLVDPSYWEEVGKYISNLPPLPEEDESIPLPELPDLSVPPESEKT